MQILYYGMMLYLNRNSFIHLTIYSLFFGSSKAYPKSSNNIFISQIARLYSMRINSFKEKIILKNNYSSIEFEKSGRRAWINGTMIFLHEPCKKSGSDWFIYESDFKLYIDPILRSYKYVSKKVPKKIVLDPGHGGKDSGAISEKKLLEKEVVLTISKYTKKLLEKHGFDVYMTRYNDYYTSLDERVNFTKKIKADLFLSIHANAATPSAMGVETFITTLSGHDSSNHYGKKNDKSSCPNNQFNVANAILGYAIQSNLLKTSSRKDRGLRRARFSVIRNSPCPAALVECGFLSNAEESNLLNDKKYLLKVASGLTNGIRAYRIQSQRANA